MTFKKTKIVATIGPASDDSKVFRQMLLSGVDVARLNFSHGTNEEKSVQIRKLRALAKELDLPLAIIADLSGPKLRLGTIEPALTLRRGQIVVLSADAALGELPIQYDFSKLVKRGQRIFLNDALVELSVKRVFGKKIEARVVNGGWISSHKGVNLPDTSLPGAAFSLKDAKDAQFALEQGVDFIALSFVEKPSDLLQVRELIRKNSLKTRVIVKIERAAAVENLGGIAKVADALMVARGDLAIETSASEVPVITQRIIRLCRQNQKPVIVATQMLESMTENPRPTRAEASDVANAVLIQADAVMLSGETARGKYPVETVRTMRDIILSVERSPEYSQYIRINWETISPEELHSSALVSSAASIAYRVKAPAIVVATATGRTVRLVSAFRPNAKILGMAHDEITQNQLNLLWGVTPFVVLPKKDLESFWKEILKLVADRKLVAKRDKLVLVGGSNSIGIPGATNTIRLITLH